MTDINTVILQGTVEYEPNTRTTPTGKSVTNIKVGTMAGNPKYPDRHNVVLWGPLSEQASRLSKGDRVRIEGRLQHRSYEPKDGSGKRYVTEVVADKLQVSAAPKRELRQVEFDTSLPDGSTPDDSIPF